MEYVQYIVIFLTLIWLNFTVSLKKRFAESETVLDPSGALLLIWKVDYEDNKIKFHIIFSDNAPKMEWFAIGFSDRGGLENADVYLSWLDYKGGQHFEDMHSDSKSKLIRDEKQDFDNYYFDKKQGILVFERFLDTCDENDYTIEDETVHIIWAHGKDKLFSSKGLCLSCTPAKKHGFVRVRLLTLPKRRGPDVNQLVLANHNLKVPGTDTTYWCKVIKLPSFLIQQPHHIVKFEPKISEGNEGLVHHMELFYCDAEPEVKIPLYNGNCFAKNRPNATQVCSKVRAAWAMGAPAFVYPNDAGLPLGGPKRNKFVMLEVHYNNPELRQNWVDSSGIVLHVTNQIRRYDAAIMELGLEYTDKMAIPGGQHAFSLTGHCVPQCTGVGLPADGIIVFASQLHTHLTGIAVWTRHSRQGRELPNLNRDMHYSTHFQEIRLLHEPVLVLPGDYLETTCVFDTTTKKNATIGGHAITDEMCVNYIHYYPATDLEVCKSSVSNEALEMFFEFEKSWDGVKISDGASYRDKYLSIKKWTPLRVSTLHTLYTESPISMQCNKSDGNRFQGDWKLLKIPNIHTPLRPKPRSCPQDRTYYSSVSEF